MHTNACGVRVRAHACTPSVAERERGPPLGSTTILPRRNRAKEWKKERYPSRSPLSSIDTRFNNDAALYSLPDNLLSLLFIANFTPPESSPPFGTGGNNERGTMWLDASCTVVHGGHVNVSSNTNIYTNIRGSIHRARILSFELLFVTHARVLTNRFEDNDWFVRS